MSEADCGSYCGGDSSVEGGGCVGNVWSDDGRGSVGVWAMVAYEAVMASGIMVPWWSWRRMER